MTDCKACIALFLISLTLVLSSLTQLCKAEPVEVTIRKLPEPASQIPAAITVWDAEAIASKGLNQPTTLAQYTPGFSFNDPFGRFNPAPSMRGLIQPGLGDDPSVGFFADGQYVSGRSSINAMNFDLERIEIARGPQNALYGRNSFGGTVNAISALPTSEATAGLSTRYAPDREHEVAGFVSGPLEPNLTARLAVYGKDKDAWFANRVANGPKIGAETSRDGLLRFRQAP